MTTGEWQEYYDKMLSYPFIEENEDGYPWCPLCFKNATEEHIKSPLHERKVFSQKRKEALLARQQEAQQGILPPVEQEPQQATAPDQIFYEGFAKGFSKGYDKGFQSAGEVGYKGGKDNKGGYKGGKDGGNDGYKGDKGGKDGNKGGKHRGEDDEGGGKDGYKGGKDNKGGYKGGKDGGKDGDKGGGKDGDKGGKDGGKDGKGDKGGGKDGKKGHVFRGFEVLPLQYQ